MGVYADDSELSLECIESSPSSSTSGISIGILPSSISRGPL